MATQKLSATVSQIRKALLTLTPEKIKTEPKSMGWALLDTLQKDGKRFSGRSIVERGLDWEATILVQRYCEMAKAMRAENRRPAGYAVFTVDGFDKEATDAEKAKQ